MRLAKCFIDILLKIHQRSLHQFLKLGLSFLGSSKIDSVYSILRNSEFLFSAYQSLNVSIVLFVYVKIKTFYETPKYFLRKVINIFRPRTQATLPD